MRRACQETWMQREETWMQCKKTCVRSRAAWQTIVGSLIRCLSLAPEPTDGNCQTHTPNLCSKGIDIGEKSSAVKCPSLTEGRFIGRLGSPDGDAILRLWRPHTPAQLSDSSQGKIFTQRRNNPASKRFSGRRLPGGVLSRSVPVFVWYLRDTFLPSHNHDLCLPSRFVFPCIPPC